MPHTAPAATPRRRSGEQRDCTQLPQLSKGQKTHVLLMMGHTGWRSKMIAHTLKCLGASDAISPQGAPLTALPPLQRRQVESLGTLTDYQFAILHSSANHMASCHFYDLQIRRLCSNLVLLVMSAVALRVAIDWQNWFLTCEPTKPGRAQLHKTDVALCSIRNWLQRFILINSWHSFALKSKDPINIPVNRQNT